MIQILVLLEVNDQGAFREFESRAIRVMKKYGGTLVSAFEPDIQESSDKRINEIHYLEFPSLEAFKNYRADDGLLKLKELRNKAIASTTVYVSGKPVTYE